MPLPRHRPLPRLLAVLLLAAVLAGCSEEAEPSSPSALSDAQFIEQADTICAGAVQAVDSLEEPESPEQLAGYLGQLLDAVRAQEDSLALLEPASDGARDVQRSLVGASAEARATLEGAITAAESGDTVTAGDLVQEAAASTTSAEQRAREFGLQVCGSEDPTDGPVEEPGDAELGDQLGDPVTPPDEEATVTDLAVVLQGDGLGVVDGASGRTTQLPFGTPVEDVETALGRVLGAPFGGGEFESCGLPYTEYDGITVVYEDGGLVGWSTTEDSGLTTLDGIGTGVTLAEVRTVAPEVEVTEGSFGPEFLTAGGLVGFLDGDAEQSLVTQLSAGQPCFVS